jgi:hypothetical protein
MDPLDAAITETDIPRVRQIVLDDLGNAERTLADVSAAGPDPERAGHLRAVRAAIAELEKLVAPLPES